LSNNNSEEDDNWKYYTHKLQPKRVVTKYLLNLVLLSFFEDKLSEVSAEDLITLSFYIKLSNGEENLIRTLTFHNTGEVMFHKISYLLNYNLTLRSVFPKEGNKEHTQTEMIFKYKIKN
jgi:hypothetical protein